MSAFKDILRWYLDLGARHQRFNNINNTEDLQSGFALIVVAWMTWVVGHLRPLGWR